MQYESTRNRQMKVSAHQAVIRGLAPDGGLYTPEKFTAHIDPKDILGCSYQEISARIIGALLDDYTKEEIESCVKGAYDDKFDTKEIVPLRKIRDAWLMDLWHGPTSAFKDIALTILPRLLSTAYTKEQRTDIISILTATSGDTGKAALSGFADVPHTAITVFYPEIGVSAIQKRQMQTSRGKNVDVIAVKGNFDDCQRMVKQAVNDPEVKASLQGVSISSANSINIGRLVPQVVYYYSSYAKLVQEGAIACGDPVTFVVPTGNFGDILAGYFAKMLGLPVKRLVCASNTNNVLTDFLHTGTYSIQRPFHTTMSPSMDILISSNLERLLFLLSDHDDVMVKEMMEKLAKDGSYTISEDLLKKIDETFSAYWTSEEECAETIHTLFEEEHQVIDPHTAVALHAARAYQKETGAKEPVIVLSTASPYKFSHDVVRCLDGEDIIDDFKAMERLHELSGQPVPKGLSELKDLPVRFTRSIEQKDGMHVIAERMKEIAHVQD